jgi:hypothetical protein
MEEPDFGNPVRADFSIGRIISSVTRSHLPRTISLFFFCYYEHHRGAVSLVNVDRVKEILPGLLVDGKTTKRKGWNAFMQSRYQLHQFQRRKPERFNSLTHRLVMILEEFNREIDS